MSVKTGSFTRASQSNENAEDNGVLKSHRNIVENQWITLEIIHSNIISFQEKLRFKSRAMFFNRELGKKKLTLFRFNRTNVHEVNV